MPSLPSEARVPTAPANSATSLEAEGDRQRLLEMGAAGHRRIAIAPRQGDQRLPDLIEVALDQRERRPDLEDGRGVHDVLGRRAPVQVAAGLAELARELADQRQDRVADVERLAPELRLVDHRDRGALVDRTRRVGRNDAGGALGSGERPLGRDIGLDRRVFVEDRAHLGGAEDVAEEAGIDGRDAGRVERAGHVSAPPPGRGRGRRR
jgi:hypothetical protein